MKISTKILAGLALGVFGLSANSFAATGTATGTSTIIAPISITKVNDLNFGNIAAGTSDGTVVLAPAGTRTKTGGVSLPTAIGTVTAASFTVNGEGSFTYAITLPSTDYTLTRTTGAQTMTVNTFSSTPNATGTLASGTQTLLVGATLNVTANQTPGVYTNATGFDVTVDYN